MVNVNKKTILVFPTCFLVILHLGSLSQGIVPFKALFGILAIKSGNEAKSIVLKFSFVFKG